MNIFAKRILATIIDILEGLLFAGVMYFFLNLKQKINMDFYFLFLFCYLFAAVTVIFLTKRKTLGEAFLRIRTVKKNSKDVNLFLLALKNFSFALILILAVHDYQAIIWIVSFLIFMLPYNSKEGLNGLDFMFGTKSVEDYSWRFSKS